MKEIIGDSELYKDINVDIYHILSLVSPDEWTFIEAGFQYAGSESNALPNSRLIFTPELKITKMEISLPSKQTPANPLRYLNGGFISSILIEPSFPSDKSSTRTIANVINSIIPEIKKSDYSLLWLKLMDGFKSRGDDFYEFETELGARSKSAHIKDKSSKLRLVSQYLDSLVE